MTVRVYKSTDVGAPVLRSDIAGSLVTVMKACLINGYGSGPDLKPAAGWTLEIDGANDILVRNVGSLSVFRIKDDGFQEITQSTPNYNLATITGAQEFDTIITNLLIPFPRTITGQDRHSNTYYGVTIVKNLLSDANITWIVVADENTCYLLTPISTDTGFNSSTAGANVNMFGFGDFKLLGNITSNPKGFVHGCNFAAAIYTGFATPGLAEGGYMEHSLDSNAGTRFYINQGYGVSSVSNTSTDASTLDNTAIVYPSPITGGMVLEPFIICDDTNNVVRTTKHTNYLTERFATYAGVYGCLHTLGVFGGAYKICDNFDTVTANGRDYLLFNLTATSGFSAYRVIAIDMTGPW